MHPQAKSEEKGREETKVLIESLDAQATALQAKVPRHQDACSPNISLKSLSLSRDSEEVRGIQP
eukprot:462874-Amorphochlora_amoeboformis.AAC.1